MRGRGSRRDYGWSEARAELELGVDPEVVACRIGVFLDTVLNTATLCGWPVSFRGPSPDQVLVADIFT